METLAQEISSSLAAANLVPGPASNIIPSNFQPTTRLHVVFPNGGRVVRFGDLFRAGECKEAPSVSFEREAEEGGHGGAYVVMLVDPDAPTPDDPRFSFWRHWVVEHGDGENTLTEYLGPGPKDDSKPHRYLFLLFRAPAGLGLAKEDVGGDEFVQRRSFKLEEFIQKHELCLVGLNWMRGVGDGWQE